MGLFDNILDSGIQIFDGFVTEVNEAEQLCLVNISAEGEEPVILPDVALRSVADGDTSGFVCIPAVDAHVVFAKIEGQSDYVLIKTSALQKVVLNCDYVVFNEGLNEGLVKVVTLTEKLNALEKQLNDLKQVISSWVPVPHDGGAALKGAVAGWAGQTLITTTKADLQNDKITH